MTLKQVLMKHRPSIMCCGPHEDMDDDDADVPLDDETDLTVGERDDLLRTEIPSESDIQNWNEMNDYWDEGDYEDFAVDVADDPTVQDEDDDETDDE